MAEKVTEAEEERGTLLVDTSILVDYLRDRPAAVQLLEGATERLLISPISVAELYAGVRDGRERRVLEEFLGAFEVVPVGVDVAREGGLLRRDYGPGHGTGLADALIAASARHAAARLATLDRRHFPMLEDLLVPY